MRRSNSLLEPALSGRDRRSPRRSISLFDDEDRYLPPLPRQPFIAGLGRKYRDSGKLSTTALAVDKIEEQPEEPPPAGAPPPRIRADDWDCTSLTENNSLSECPSLSASNCLETTSSRSGISGETSPTESTSNILDYSSSYKTAGSSLSTKDLQSRLLAAENLIKESQMKNLGLAKYNPNLSSNYQDLDKCDKESLGAISESASAAIAKRRSCIPSLRLRSGSLTRDSSLGRERRPFMGSEDAISVHALTPERSFMSKFFRSSSSSSRDAEARDKSEAQQKPKQRRISRFLRPDFFDTPREESQYVKEKEAQKAAENERRKSRFMKRKSESRSQPASSAGKPDEEKLDKELKNEANSLTKGRSETPSKEQHTDEESRSLGEKPSIKSSFLQSLERKLEKFRSGDDGTSKSNSKPPVPDDNRTQSAVEKPVPPVKTPPSAVKRAISDEDLSTPCNDTCAPTPPKSKVNSVLGLFKNSDSKCEQSAAPRAPGQTILSRLRKNTYKGSRSDGVLSPDASSSKIPTKLSKAEAKSSKKLVEAKKSPEKTTLGFKRSPSKDKEKEPTPPKRISPESKKPAMERLSKPFKKSPDKLIKAKPEKTDKSAELKSDSSASKLCEKNKSPEKTFLKKNCSPEKSFLKAKSPEKIVDNKQVEEMNGDNDEKNGAKIKKKMASSTASSETASVKSDKTENVKKVKKVTKTKESADKEKDKEGGETTKKKKVVRVVKKVVKKSSDAAEVKPDDKDKPAKTLIKKMVVSKKEKSPESTTSTVIVQRKSPENHTPLLNDQMPEPKEKLAAEKADLKNVDVNDVKEKSSDSNIECQRSKAASQISQLKTVDTKPNREKLKLDFSKIPQHNFRNVTPPRRESPKSETPKIETSEIPRLVQRSQSDSVSKKVTENVSKIAHRASIAVSKLTDEPLQAKDITTVKRETPNDASTSSYKENYTDESTVSNQVLKENNNKSNSVNSPLEIEKNNIEETKEVKVRRSSLRDPVIDDLMSPTEDSESFDSWSICSADINHTRGDLHSPTSPTYSMYMRGDNPNTESVIDRIRRKSFYTRFNDRKRKASLNAPPPGINMSSSVTLPRKFSFHSSKDSNKDQKSKANNYSLPVRKNSEKCYSMYNDDAASLRKSPIERERYSDGGSASSYSNDFKSPSESYGHISSSYDPLRKYLSPTFDSSAARRKYHSTEFSTDNDLGSYRNSSLTDTILEPSLGRNLSTLPRRYGSSVSGFEPKTVEYYEELLAPNNTDYLGGRRASPLPHENYSKYENGYHNGGTELPQFCAEKWKSHVDKPTKSDLAEGIQTENRTRKISQCISESDDLSTSSLDQRATTSTAE